MGYWPKSTTPGATLWVLIAYENPFNPATSSYGSLGFDNRHQVAGDILWSQPFKASNKALNGLIAGWTVACKIYVYSGAPFSVTDSKIATDVNATGVLTPLADLVVPSAFGMSCNEGNAIGKPCLPKTDFATYPGSGINAPIQTDWGNIAPNSFRGPGYFDLDMTLQRSFAIKEKYKFTFGMQAYNVLNHPNFANPSENQLTRGAFGRNHQHSRPAHQHLRYGPGRLGFGTPDGLHGNVFVLGNAIHCGEWKRGGPSGSPFFIGSVVRDEARPS